MIYDEIRTLAGWVRAAQSDSVPQHRKIDMGDIDADLLDRAADLLEEVRDRLKDMQ